MYTVRLHGCYGIRNLGDDYILMAELSLIDKLKLWNMKILLDSENGYNGVKHVVEKFPNLHIEVFDPNINYGKIDKIKIWSNVDYYIFGGGGVIPFGPC